VRAAAAPVTGNRSAAPRDDDDNAQFGEKPLPLAMMMMRGEFP
jgi:hypothetical protein